jgi:hypothetical protein
VHSQAGVLLDWSKNRIHQIYTGADRFSKDGIRGGCILQLSDHILEFLITAAKTPSCNLAGGNVVRLEKGGVHLESPLIIGDDPDPLSTRDQVFCSGDDRGCLPGTQKAINEVQIHIGSQFKMF